MSQPTIVVSADGTPDAALKRAGELAAAGRARLVLVSAYEPVHRSRLRAERRECPEEFLWAINPHEDVDARLEHAREQILDSVPVLTRSHRGGVAEGLLAVAHAEGADLVVVGTDKDSVMRRAQRRINGRVTREAGCDVAIVCTGHDAAA
jgi:nucleotide-binding universal stress UspA family protein